MLLTIAILSGIGCLFSMLDYGYNKGTFDCNMILMAILVLSTWDLCFPIAIIALIISGLMIVSKL